MQFCILPPIDSPTHDHHRNKLLVKKVIKSLHTQPKDNHHIDQLIKRSFSLPEKTQIELFSVIFHKLSELQKMQVLIHCKNEIKPQNLAMLIISIFGRTYEMIKYALIELISEIPDIEKSKAIIRVISLCDNKRQKSDLYDQIFTLKDDKLFLYTVEKTFEYMNIKQRDNLIRQTFHCENSEQKFITLTTIYEKASSEQKLYLIDTIFSKFQGSKFMLEVYEIFNLNPSEIIGVSANDIKDMLKKSIQNQNPEITFGTYTASVPSFQQQTL